MNNEEIEVLAFRRGLERAHVVTDGRHTRSYEESGATAHESLTKAIAYLEGKGFKIITDQWL